MSSRAMSRYSSPVVELPVPPEELAPEVREYLDNLRSAAMEHLLRAATPGIFRVHEIDLIQPPTGGYGLPVGAVYVDASGFLKMKQAGEIWAPRVAGTLRIGGASIQ